MMVEKKCKYHISLVRKRWYKETIQDITDLKLKLAQEPFIFAELQQQKQDSNSESYYKGESYMKDVQCPPKSDRKFSRSGYPS